MSMAMSVTDANNHYNAMRIHTMMAMSVTDANHYKAMMDT